MATAYAYVFGGKDFTRWNNVSRAVSAVPITAQSVDQSIAEIVTAAEQNQGKPISVVISWAGTEKEGGNFELNNFPIRTKPRAVGTFNFRQELEQALKAKNLDPSLVKLSIHNDGDLSLCDCALQDGLKNDTRALGILLGTGLSVSLGEGYKGNGEFTKIISADAPKMPGLQENQAVEGAMRKYSEQDPEGTAAAYITGGHEGENKLGAKATAVHLASLASDKSKEKELKEALKLLYGQSGFFKKMWNFISLGGMRQRKQVKNSELVKLFKQHQTISNDALINAAKSGDKLSLQILMFTAKRVVDFMQQYLESIEKDKQPEQIYFYGTFANQLFSVERVKKYFEKDLGKISKARLNIRSPEMDGARDMAERLSSV